jgi:drug/metabolite transporter (DMT)-like permease
MHNGVSSVPARSAGRERRIGTVFTFLSTLFYAVSNAVVRYLTAHDVDIDWILFFKETIGFSILVPWLLFRLGQGRFQYISRRLILHVVFAAVFCQLIGARLHMLGFAVIGLIIAVPLIQSSTLLSVALIGHFVLGDPLSQRRKIAMTILIVAITFVSIGKGLTVTNQPSAEHTVSAGYSLLVAAGTVVTGIAYAVYIIMLRRVIRQYWKDENSARLSFKFRHWVGHDHAQLPGKRFYSPFPVTFTMSIVFAVGTVIFGTFLYGKYGITGFYSVPNLTGISAHVARSCILISGISNAIGFFFQVQGLRMTSAVQASFIAVSQMLLLSLIGYLYFDEAINMVVMIGLGLIVYGVFMSAKPERQPE